MRRALRAWPVQWLTGALPRQGGGEKLRKCTQLGMIAGGTGITPMLQVRWSWVRRRAMPCSTIRVEQVIAAVLKDPGDKTKVRAVSRADGMHRACSRVRAAHRSRSSSRTRRKTTSCAVRCGHA